MNPFLGTVYRAAMPLQRMMLKRRVRRLAVERVDGISLAVLPDVFNGVVFRTGALLARSVAAFPPPFPEARALDMGTGSGIGALFSVRAGYKVIAVDVNPEAVRCARANAILNNLEDRVEVRQGDLWDAVSGEKFHLVLFNPPFFGGDPRDLHDLSWRGGDVFRRFVAGLPEVLEPRGVALVILSTHGDKEGQSALLNGAPLLQASPHEVRHFGNETLTIFSVRHRVLAA